MNLLKIAKILVSEYKYIYDPDHLQHPGKDFHKTDDGWSNKKERKKDWENSFDDASSILDLENLYKNIKDLDSIDENSLKEALKDYPFFRKAIIEGYFKKYNLYDPDSFKEFKQYLYKNFDEKLKAKNFELLDSNIGGSTGAGLYKDGNGNKFVIKTYHGNKDQVNNELLANQIYKLFGVNVPDSKIVKLNDQIGVANSYIDGLSEIDENDRNSDSFKRQVLDKFAIDAWLANWDAVGLTFDNLLKDKNGNFFRIDNGGALLYRAQGTPKGELFGSDVKELETLRDPKINPSSASIFSSLTDEDIINQINHIDNEKKNQAFDIIDKIYEKTPDIAEKIKNTLENRLIYMRKWAEEKKLDNKDYTYNSYSIGDSKPFPLSSIPNLLNEEESNNLMKDFVKFWKSQNKSVYALEELSIDKNLSEQKEYIENKLREQIGKGKNLHAYQKVFDIITNYSGSGYYNNSNLSALIKKSEGYIAKDYRMLKYSIDIEPTEDMVKMFRLFRKKEQEFLLKSGLVDKDGYIYLFRSSEQVPENMKKSENIWEYNGGYAESWTVFPRGFSSAKPTYMARIHYSKVIASSIGNEKINLFNYNHEGEIIVDAKDIDSVVYFPKYDDKLNINDIYLDQIQENYENIEDIVSKHEKLNGKINKKLSELDFIENPTEKQLENLKKYFPELTTDNSVTDNILIYKLMIKHNPELKSFLDHEPGEFVNKNNKEEKQPVQSISIDNLFKDHIFFSLGKKDEDDVEKFHKNKDQIVKDLCVNLKKFMDKNNIDKNTKLNASSLISLKKKFLQNTKQSDYKNLYDYEKAKNAIKNMSLPALFKVSKYVLNQGNNNDEVNKSEKNQNKIKNKPNKKNIKVNINDLDKVKRLFTDDLFEVDSDDKLEVEKLNERKKDIVNSTCNDLGDFKNS